MRQFSFDHDENFDQQQDRQRIIQINNRSQSQNTIMQRFQSSILRVPRLTGVYAQFPNIQNAFNTPYVNDVIQAQQRTILFTPAPPIIRNQSEKAIWKMVKKFANKYEHLWILIANLQTNKQLNQVFTQIYAQQKLSNVNQVLQNMLTPEDFQRAKLFTKQGLDIKIMMDYYSYSRYVAKDIKSFQQNNRILQMFVQSDKDTKRGVIGTKKLKNVHDLVELIQNQVKHDIQKCRKDKPYFNFIHFHSTPQLFNRRSIIKNCISAKYQSQIKQNHKNFIALLKKFNDDQRDSKIKEVRKLKLDQIQLGSKINQINQKHRRFQEINQQFAQKFERIITKYYPIQKQPQWAKKQIYDYIISQYCIQSSLYPVINNTIRFSNSTQKIRPLSPFIKYLFDAIRYYFTTRFRDVNFNVVYRGARISLVQQRSFKQGRYMWNLGFMSTSRSKKVAEGFLATGLQTQEKVLIIIQIPKITSSIQYLWDQEGFYSLDYINEIKKYIIKQEQEVLFNPLNTFKILKWDSANRLLVLRYSPHLQLLQRKKNGGNVDQQQQQLLRSVYKLQDVSYDKGQQLLQQGDPGGAIKYYQQSDQSGSNLSFSQKSNYIKGLMEVNNLQKMELMIKDSLQQQKNAEKQLLSTQTTLSQFSMVEKLADSVQSLALFQQTTNFQIADQRAEFAKSSSFKMAKNLPPTQQILLLQTKTYIQLSKIKFGVSQTFDSIKQGIRSLKMIDQLANINLSFRLWHIDKDLREIKNMKISQNMRNLKNILSNSQFHALNNQQQKLKDIQRIQNVRRWNIQSDPVQKFNNPQIIRGNTSGKSDHKKAEKILQEYFNQRDKRSEAQRLQEMFVYAYWQSERIKIQREKTTIQQQIEQREKLKVIQQRLLQVKNDYKDLFQHQIEAYEVLYRNIYKTSINVQSCLNSYHRNAFRRYRNFIQAESKYEGESVDKAEVLWKYGQILCQYGQIIQRSKMNDKSQMTDAQREGEALMKQAEQVITRIQGKKSRITGNNKQTYTYQKNQIRRAITRYFKKKAIDKDQARKLSVAKPQNQYYISSSQQKNNSFSVIIKALNQSKQLIESDASIDKPLYKIKNSMQKIQVVNQSCHILVSNESYIERLKSCRMQFDDVLATIQKYKEKELMERNINMGHLYLLMAENQFRLGLILSAKNFLKQSDECIKKALKLQNDNDSKKIIRLNRQKLLLGNITHINCLRLQAHIVAFYGNVQEQKALIETLRAKRQTMFNIMHQPLSEADIYQSIGIIATNLILKYRQLNFQDAQKPLRQAIKIRQKLLGPFNKINARNYTFLVQLIALPHIYAQYYKQIQAYYKLASQIYNRIDLSQDYLLIVFRMQLQSTFFMFTYRQKQASVKILQNLQLLDRCQNMHLTLQAAQQLYRCSLFLSQQTLHQRQGLDWLKLTYRYTSTLESMVKKTYSMSDADLRSFHLTKLKVKILQRIVELQIKLKGAQVDKYCFKYKKQKQKLNLLINNQDLSEHLKSQT